MADIDLPVFSIAPNWKGGIKETLEWLTDVLGSMTGYEQRRGVRLTPRRYFEATFNPIGNLRSFLDLWMARFAEKEFLLPLWHDKAKLSANAAAGAVRLNFDNTYREFLAGGLALVYQDAFNYQVVSITTQDANGLDLGTALAKSWLAGSVVYPLRPAYLDEPEGALDMLSTRVGEIELAFRLSRENPYTAGAEVLPLYAGYPLVTLEPNRADDQTVRYARLFEDNDRQIGKLYRRDEAGRAFTTQFYNWQARGRQKHHELRQTLYRLNGRQKAVWMPSFNDDVTLARNLAIGSNRLDIQIIGYRYLGGPAPGRDYILLRDNNGAVQIVNITGTSVPLAATEDRLNLSANSTFAATAGRIGSFVQLVRLDQDVVEITHHTDSDGMSECSAAFKSFAAGRTTAGSLVYPTPIGVQDPLGACGEPGAGEASACIELPPEFEGWILKLRYNMYRNEGPLENSFQDTDPVDVANASQNINFTPKVGSWVPSGTAGQEAGRPVSRTSRYNGAPYTAWFNANNAYLEMAYWDSGGGSADVIATFAAVPQGGQLEVYWQKQHSVTTVASNTRGYIEYAWWDVKGDGLTWGSFQRVQKADYIQEDGYTVDGAGTFPIPSLWPVSRIFRIYRG